MDESGIFKMPLGMGSRSRTRPHYAIDGVPAPAKGAQQPPLFGPCLLWPRSPISATCIFRQTLSKWHASFEYSDQQRNNTIFSFCLSSNLTHLIGVLMTDVQAFCLLSSCRHVTMKPILMTTSHAGATILALDWSDFVNFSLYCEN